MPATATTGPTASPLSDDSTSSSRKPATTSSGVEPRVSAPVASASEVSTPSKRASRRDAFENSAPRTDDPEKSASSAVARTNTAPSSLAPPRSAPMRIDCVRLAPVRSAPRRLARLRSMPTRFAPARSAPARSTPRHTASGAGTHAETVVADNVAIVVSFDVDGDDEQAVTSSATATTTLAGFTVRPPREPCSHRRRSEPRTFPSPGSRPAPRGSAPRGHRDQNGSVGSPP